MSKIYALINNGIIENTIKADQDFINYINNDYQSIIEITNTNPIPSIGWEFDGINFINPENIETVDQNV